MPFSNVVHSVFLFLDVTVYCSMKTVMVSMSFGTPENQMSIAALADRLLSSSQTKHYSPFLADTPKERPSFSGAVHHLALMSKSMETPVGLLDGTPAVEDTLSQARASSRVEPIS